MPESQLTPAAAEALGGPFSVEYHDNWPDMYHLSGNVPGEDDEENTADDERGRHDVRRLAIEFLPEMLSLLSLAESLVEDADDRGELDHDDETARKGRALLDGAREVFRSINAAAAPHELETIDAPPEEFRAWLAEHEGRHVGMPGSPSLNPVALFLEQRHGGLVDAVEDTLVRFADGSKNRTLPYMDRFLEVVESTYGGPVSSAGALRILDGVLAGVHDDDSAR